MEVVINLSDKVEHSSDNRNHHRAPSLRLKRISVHTLLEAGASRDTAYPDRGQRI